MLTGHWVSKLSRKQRGRLAYCETFLKNIHTLQGAPVEMSRKQELRNIPYRPWEAALSSHRPTLSARCAETVPALQLEAGEITQPPSSCSLFPLKPVLSL